MFRRGFEVEGIPVVGINNPLEIDDIAYRLHYDSTDGRCLGQVGIDGNDLNVNSPSVITSDHNAWGYSCKGLDFIGPIASR
ncbi:hypothetical protein KBY97_01710 [Synechococcus sp. ATX 2A4]|nr:hypothetical protein [Synechococcus sp. ATX 2A4]